jgi:signal transduction histidine kinase
MIRLALNGDCVAREIDPQGDADHLPGAYREGMGPRWSRLSPADQVLFDRLLAGTVFVLGQVEIWVVGSIDGPTWVTSPTVGLASLALLGRRRAPLAAMLVVGLAVALYLAGLAGLAHDPGQAESLAMLAIWVVAAYSVGAHATLGKALLGAAIAAALPAFLAATSDVMELDPVTELFVLVPWFAGRALRGQRAQAARLEQLARDLATEREERARNAVLEERARIARELHDIVAHGVSVIAVQADAAEGALSRDPALARKPLASVKDTARDMLAELRRSVGVLRADDAHSLSPRPGLDQLPALVEQTRRAGLLVDLRTEGTPWRLSAGADLSAYRIVQESLTNVCKHAGASRAIVRVRYDDRSLTVEICDDGVGPTGDTTGGHGLVGIRERVALYGGNLHVGLQPTGGFVVRAVLPLDGNRP